MVPSDQIVEQLLKAAMEAPSSGNLQSRFVYVVKDDDLRRKFAKLSLDQDFIHQAPLALVFCADQRIEGRYGKRGQELYSVLDCAAAIENLMLLAVELGLGTCWVGAFEEEKLSELLKIPPHLRPISIITLGYPDESPEPPERQSLSEKFEYR